VTPERRNFRFNSRTSAAVMLRPVNNRFFDGNKTVLRIKDLRGSAMNRTRKNDDVFVGRGCAACQVE